MTGDINNLVTKYEGNLALVISVSQEYTIDISQIVSEYNISKEYAQALIDKDKIDVFKEYYNEYPSHLSPNNRAKVFLMGYSPDVVEKFNVFDRINEFKIYKWATDEWKEEKLMGFIMSNYVNERKGRKFY